MRKTAATSERALKAAVQEAFEGERGPGSMPPKKGGHAIAAIVPHGELAWPAIAWGYHELKKPDICILLMAGDKAGFSMETWQTAFGEIRADQKFLHTLQDHGSIKTDEHIDYSFVEEQLPFIQSIGEESTKIVPIMVSVDTDLEQLSLDLKEAIVDQDKDVVFVAISNMTANGRDFGRLRFTQKPQEQIYEFDKRVFETIKQQDADLFAEFAEKELINYSGTPAIELLLRLLRPCDIRMEQYYTSADLSGDYRNSESYGVIVFEEK